MLNVLAIALIQFASFTSGSTNEISAAPAQALVIHVDATTKGCELAAFGGTGGWGGDVAVLGGTGGWGGDVATLGGTGGWGGDIVALGGTGGWGGDIA